MSAFHWWWDGGKEEKLWRFLNSLPPDELKRTPKYASVAADAVERYGNIYLYKPIPVCAPFHGDSSPIRFVHGNNGSGKSYVTGADLVYTLTGKNPYRELKPPPFGSRVIWIVTTSFKIQKASSQLILFSDLESEVRDIGLLPPLDVLESMGVEVAWEDRGKSILHSLTFPGCRIEFKSMEQRAFNLAGAAVDDIWLDEAAPHPVYDECTARIIRKNGQVTMSFLLEDASASYVVTDIYEQHLKNVKEERKNSTSFYFLAIEDNIYLDPMEVKARRAAVSEEGKAWRFSNGGRFDITPRGVLLHENFDDGLHVKDDLIQQFDPLEILYRCWDLGFVTPACMIWQMDKKGRIKIYVSKVGERVQLVNFIDEIEALCTRLFPNRLAMQELLPHDSRRKDGNSEFSAEDNFNRKGLKDHMMIYVNEEPALAMINDLFGKVINGIPAIRIDSEHANLVANTCMLHTRDDKTGKPAKHPLFSHVTDNLKMMATFIAKKDKLKELRDPNFNPNYPVYSFKEAL